MKFLGWRSREKLDQALPSGWRLFAVRSFAMDITIKVDVRAAMARISAFQLNQMPQALKLAVNDLAFQIMRAEAANIAKVFKHPRPFTQSATQVQKQATKADPTAIVSVRANRQAYLWPYENGGVHHLPGKALMNPKEVSLDQYGQLTKNKIKALLARPDVFAGTIKGITGIWQRPKRHGVPLKLLIRLGSALPVHQHLHWLDHAQQIANAAWPATFGAAMDKAIKTARV
jgi:hypothetical protein